MVRKTWPLAAKMVTLEITREDYQRIHNGLVKLGIFYEFCYHLDGSHPPRLLVHRINETKVKALLEN
jgi:hypothetical protein